MACRGTLALIVCIVATYTAVYVECQCPPGTHPYPSFRPEAPDSCYLFINWRWTSWMWQNVWKYPSPANAGDKVTFTATAWSALVEYKGDKITLSSAVWSADHARRICREVVRQEKGPTWDTRRATDYQRTMWDFFDPGAKDRYVKTEPTYYHLASYDWRLPIIESEDEDRWLYDKVANDSILGTKFWIDLEYDPINEHYYWASTMDEPDVYFPPHPEQIHPDWVAYGVLLGDDDDDDVTAIKQCHEFHLNDQKTKTRGWHRRPCAQAYSKIHHSESCSAINPHLLINEEGPWALMSIPRLLAPFAVVCEYSLYPEPRKAAKPCCDLKRPDADEPAVTRPKRRPVTRRPKGQATNDSPNVVILVITMGLVNCFGP